MRHMLWMIVAAVMCAPVMAAIRVDASGYDASCGVDVRAADERIMVTWPVAGGQIARCVLDLRSGKPLIDQLGIGSDVASIDALLADVEPTAYITVGTRQKPAGKPIDQKWAVFFDNPIKREHAVHPSILTKLRASVRSAGRRATVEVGDITAGPFSGAWRFTFYAGSRLVHLEAAVSTQQDLLAIIYDLGLIGDAPDGSKVAWMDVKGRMQRASASDDQRDRAVMTKHRTIMLETAEGSIACFPPPHQFMFPRDYSDNLKYNWFGLAHQDASSKFGFGIRQNKDGGGRWVPWFNAPPDVEHRLGEFLLLSEGDANAALNQALRYTRGDRFADIPGYKTMTSHYHMATAVAAMKLKEQGVNPLPIPQWVKVFKDMNVNIIHQGEFHGDGHQKDAGPLRLPEMAAMFEECGRLSDDQLLVIPGEEINTYLGLPQPGKHPGHWMSLFPKPVFFTLVRTEDQPFIDQHPKYGRFYRVGTRAEMMRLIELEGGLVWAAHPRIKASSWTPDIFRHEDFYVADSWLGGAWKSMPGDLSREKQGERVLDLLSDMANWGQKKYVLGEVDVFKIDLTHELFGHMNINYVKLDRLPRYEDGWQPVLDALRSGQFFVTTGEVLMPRFTVGGVESGRTLRLSSDPRPELKVDLEWTFPLKFAEVISGDGRQVYRQHIDLSDTQSFGKRTLTVQPDLRGKRWVRFEVWDIAANGAFTQPVWIEP